MKIRQTIHVTVAATLFALVCSTAHAGNNAYCDVRKHGDKAKGATGNCAVHDQGQTVTIDLANDEYYTLTRKKDKKNAFKDQKGNDVQRKAKDDGTTNYKWEHKNITVSFHDAEKKKK